MVLLSFQIINISNGLGFGNVQIVTKAKGKSLLKEFGEPDVKRHGKRCEDRRKGSISGMC